MLAQELESNGIDRRQLIRMLMGVAVGAHGPWTLTAADENTGTSFSFAAVEELARKLAQRPFQAEAPLPESLRRLTYDQFRLIAFRFDRALWRDQRLPFSVEFFHRGYVARDKVDINLVEDRRERPFPFDPGLFQYRGELAGMKTSRDWGFSGWRLLCHLPSKPNFQEFCCFQGASYFRAIGVNEIYGTSARGLAIDTGLPRPEEFPAFRTFWLEHPTRTAQSFRAWALLDGPSVTGAYAFLITPGLERTTVDIDSRLFFRKAVEKLGVAPMSSMWAWTIGGCPSTDRRPQVHDSDGLLIAAANGEWLWRPLARREHPSVSRFQFDGLRGFGLMQRDRDPDHYCDDEAKYHLRPSVWIRARTPWEAGAVELLELPTDTEVNDNIAAYWVPARPVGAGDSLSLAYQVEFSSADPTEHGGGRFVVTRAEQSPNRRDIRFSLDVEGGALASLPADARLEPVVTTNHGRIVGAVCVHRARGTWQLRFRLERGDDAATELRAFLRHGSRVLTETWSDLWT